MLYRGECRSTHHSNNGKIFPKNVNGEKEVVAVLDGNFCLDGRFSLGPTEENRVAAHHIETGMYGGCSVSTTRCYDEAKKFALAGDDHGVIYSIDDDNFEQFGVVAIAPENPGTPDEQEVTIRASDGGAIPAELIVRVDFVDRT